MSAKRQIVAALARGLYLVGKRLHDGGITILSYHSLDGYGTPLSVSPALFSAQMAAISRERCVTFTMSEVADHLAARKPFPRRAVAVTFDDGFTNMVDAGLPILLRHDIKSTIYMIAGMVGRVTRWTDRGEHLPSLPMAGWEELETLRRAGVEVGAHTVTHGFLTQYGQAQLEEELLEGKAILERRLAVTVDAFAYPQGDYDARVVAATRLAGYRSAVTVDQGRAGIRSDPFLLPRVLISNNVSPQRLLAVLTPAAGPAYATANFVLKRLLGHSCWPRRAPGEVDSTGSALQPVARGNSTHQAGSA